jgi:hypothetical protein
MYQQHYLTYAARYSKGLASAIAKHYGVEATAESSDWRADVIDTYQQTREQERPLAMALAARIYALAGRVVDPEAVFIDRVAGRAVVVVDGVTHRGQVHILRQCAECGTGHLESPPIATRADLGFALAEWEPRHPGCEPEDPANWLES